MAVRFPASPGGFCLCFEMELGLGNPGTPKRLLISWGAWGRERSRYMLPWDVCRHFFWLFQEFWLYTRCKHNIKWQTKTAPNSRLCSANWWQWIKDSKWAWWATMNCLFGQHLWRDISDWKFTFHPDMIENRLIIFWKTYSGWFSVWWWRKPTIFNEWRLGSNRENFHWNLWHLTSCCHSMSLQHQVAFLPSNKPMLRVWGLNWLRLMACKMAYIIQYSLGLAGSCT